MTKKRILTGDRPTGKLHLGHYLGTLENRVSLQDDYETYIMVASVSLLVNSSCYVASYVVVSAAV